MKLPVHSVLTKRKDLIDKAYQHDQRKYICKIMAAISLTDHVWNTLIDHQYQVWYSCYNRHN